VKKTNLSTHAVATIAGLRASLDEAGQNARPRPIVGDGSFCNRTLFTADLPRTELIVRARRDLKLCGKADGGSRSFYDKVKFTPEQVLKDESVPWCTSIFHGGQWRVIRYKEVTGIYWQSGAKKRPLRLFMVAPVPESQWLARMRTYRLFGRLRTPAEPSEPRRSLASLREPNLPDACY